MSLTRTIGVGFFPFRVWILGCHCLISTAECCVSKKIKSFAHGEFNTADTSDEENIKLKIEKEEDIFDRGYKIKKVEIDSSFPKYIFKNKEKLKKWIA